MAEVRSRLGDALGCILLALVVVAIGCAARCVYLTETREVATPEPAPPPAAQLPERGAARAVPVDLPGVPNLYKVNDDLYRGAQPEDEGFGELKKLGIKTVLNLRTAHSDRDECEAAGLDYVHIHMQAWHAEDEDIVRFLRVVSDPARVPVFVHCRYGSDRTGVVMAAYRVIVDGWSREEAIREMTEGDFGFHAIWDNLEDYIREMDVEALRQEAGLTE